MSIRNYPAGPRVYIDMDGPLAQFDKYCLEHDVDPKVGKLMSLTYASLQVTPGALGAVNDLCSYIPDRVFLLTKVPSQNPIAAMQKLMWAREQFPLIKDHVIITPDKGCVGTVDDVLIDDHPEWANAHNFPGTVIKFDLGDQCAWAKIMAQLRKRLLS